MVPFRLFSLIFSSLRRKGVADSATHCCKMFVSVFFELRRPLDTIIALFLPFPVGIRPGCACTLSLTRRRSRVLQLLSRATLYFYHELCEAQTSFGVCTFLAAYTLCFYGNKKGCERSPRTCRAISMLQPWLLRDVTA